MNIQNQTIDWKSSDILVEIANNIQNPLSSIIEINDRASKQSQHNNSQQTAAEITLINSRKIADLVDEVLQIAKSKSVNILNKQEPVIFEIYNANPQVRSMCLKEIVPGKISETDKNWLFNLENAVFEGIKRNQITLYNLAFEVAVSERQLHRNIKSLLALTPNKYIRILKLHKAKTLLEAYTYRTISEVAYAVCFYDVYYFSKVFYQQYGAMPKDYLP